MKNIKFINAGAGSGKTHRLTEILSKWVKKEGNNADKVLLTTFTKKAASEIRERAQAKLLVDDEFIQINKLQEAFIGTVHSVGYQFIKKYWYLLGISPELTEISEIEKDIYFSLAIGEIPTDAELDSLDKLCYQFDFRDSNNFYNPRQWKEDVQELMKTSLLNNINIDGQYNQSIKVSEEKINKLFKGDLPNSKVKPLLLKMKEILENEGTKARSSAQKECNILLSYTGKIDLRYLLKVSKLIGSLQKVYPDGKTKKYEAVRALFPLENIQDFEIFKNGVLKYNKLIFCIAGRSLKKYSEFKQKKGLVDYTDMEVYFLKLLNEDIVQREIEKTIKLVMVDEFQDSNPIQLSIFMKLSQLVEQSFWVGDPKQAIYGFRGADPVLIDQIIREFTKQNENGLSIDILKMSWRSVPELVSLSNQIFEERMSEQASDIYLETTDQIHGPDMVDLDSDVRIRFDKWVENRKIHPLEKNDTIGLLPARNTSNDLNGSPIKFWNFLDNGKNSTVTMNQSVFFQKLANKVVSIIDKGKKGSFMIIDKKSEKSRNIVGSDICILVYTSKKVSDLAEEFYNLGCPVNALVEGLTDTVEYRILQNIVTLFIDKNNALSSTELAYLTGENNSVSGLLEERINLLLPLLKRQKNEEEFNFYEVLEEWLKDSDHKKSIEELKNQSSYLSVFYTLQKIINQFNIFQKLLNFKNSDLRQANILKLCELAKNYETYCINMNLGSGLLGFLSFVESNKDLNKQANNTNKDAVNIMTYHKSKGLEWPMVILSDLGKDPLDKFQKYEMFSTKIKNNSEIDVSKPLYNRSIEFSFWPFGTSTSVNEALKEKIENTPNYIEKETSKFNEYSRLMYVGITRARDYIVFATNQYKNATWLEEVMPNWELNKSLEDINYETTEKLNFFNLKKVCYVDYEKIMPDTEFKTRYASEAGSYFNKKVSLRQNNPYFINPSDANPVKDFKVILLERLNDRLIFETNDSTELGNSLHQLLYIKNRSYFKEAVNNSEAFETLGINCNQFIDHTKLFNQWLVSKFNIKREYRELHLEVMINEQLARGEADLVLDTDEGLVLIDYKSYAGSDDITNIACDYYAGKYSGQLDLYAQMLEKTFEPKKVVQKLIYYVVQGKIVELKSDMEDK